MNFFAWTINYALIPAPTAASLHDASSILTFALLPLLLPPPPPFLLAIVSARDTDQGTSRTRVHREILNRVCVHAPPPPSPFPPYIYILSLLASCSPVYRETARYLRAKERERERREAGLVEKKRRKRRNGRRAKKATNRRVVVERRRRERRRERWRGKEREGSRGMKSGRWMMKEGRKRKRGETCETGWWKVVRRNAEEEERRKGEIWN